MSDNFTPYAIIMGDYADKEAQKRFPEGRVGGNQDAFRHLVWQGMLQKKYPSIAKFLGNLHETSIPFVGSPYQGKSEKEMDLYNNALGRKIADQAKSYEDIYRIAEEYVNKGRVKTVPESILNKESKY